MASPQYKLVHGNPVCRYDTVSSGDGEARIPAFNYVKEVPIGWGPACRLTYGPKSHGVKKPTGNPECAYPDASYAVKAQAKAIEMVDAHK
jgi:hypothetical protein